MRHAWFSYLMFATLHAAACAVQPASQGQSAGLELYPTPVAVGVEAGPFEFASAEMFWRPRGENSWRNGVDMVHDKSAGLACAGIWPLEPGSAVEVRVVLKDENGGELQVLDGTTVTRSLAFEATGGKTIHVSPLGDDGNPGSADKPLGTISRAVSLAGPGDRIVAAGGVYREGGLFAGLTGETGSPVVICAEPGARPVIDGSVEIAPGTPGWLDEGDGVFSTGFESPTGYLGYVAQDGLRMYKCRSLDLLRSAEGATSYEEPFSLGRAWHYDSTANRLYVRTGDSSSPEQHLYNVAVQRHGALFSRSRNVVLQGFELCYFGESAVRFEQGAEGCAVVECVIRNAPVGLTLAGEDTRDNLIWNNEIYESGLTDFSWNAIKGSNYGRQGITGGAGRGTSICYNTIHGWFDGIAPVSWLNPDNRILNRDFDIMFNLIYNIGDDAVEVDGGGVNMRIHGNTIRNSFAAISLAPVERGPVYCTRNDAEYYILMFKLNVGSCTSLGPAFCYHNTGVCLTRGRAYGGTAISFPPGASIPISDKTFINNVFVCDGLGVRFGHEGYTIDSNCYWPVEGEEPVSWQWEWDRGDDGWESRSFRSLDEFSRESGRETSGLYADPLLVSPPSGDRIVVRREYGNVGFSAYPQVEGADSVDLRLRPDSPCIDRGMVIRGVNEDFSGKAPDMGAFEYVM